MGYQNPNRGLIHWRTCLWSILGPVWRVSLIETLIKEGMVLMGLVAWLSIWWHPKPKFIDLGFTRLHMACFGYLNLNVVSFLLMGLLTLVTTIVCFTRLLTHAMAFVLVSFIYAGISRCYPNTWPYKPHLLTSIHLIMVMIPLLKPWCCLCPSTLHSIVLT